VAIFKKLFPSVSPEYLAQPSRDELLRLVNGAELPSPPPPGQPELTEPLNLDPESDDEREWNEPQETQDPDRAMCDDVNGLSLSLDHRSYMGVSSTQAILRTILRLRPSMQENLRNDATNNWGVTSPSASSYKTPLIHESPNLAPAIDEKKSIDEYFAQVHANIPVLDEADFRLHWERGDRTDRPWHALLNMVLTLGSLAAGDAQDHSHDIYYMRAKAYLDFELLGTGCVESVQALCLLGGTYLHYKKSPNMGYALMGAAFRVAVALGLHHEPVKPNMIPGNHLKPQVRRRIWWALFCADTWGSMTLGRTTLGRWNPETMNIRSPSDEEKRDSSVLILDCARVFCLIGTKVQHRFAQFQPIAPQETNEYDLEVVNWYQSIPPELRDPGTCPTRLALGVFVMHNRYFNLRLLLFRPFLLSYANRKADLESLPPEEQVAIHKCQDIACEAIDQMVSRCEPLTRVRVWSAAWFLYQATVVILLSLIVNPEHDDSENWRAHIEMALELFERMAPWSQAASRSKHVVTRIYDTCALPQSFLTDIPSFDFDMAVYQELGLDMFQEGWQWDMINWSENLSLPPEWHEAQL
jgi:hypothetical protein